MLETYDSKILQARIEYLEKNKRYFQNALETVLSGNSFYGDAAAKSNPENILKETQQRINTLIPFKAIALYLVDEESSNFKLSVCEPDHSRQLFEDKTGTTAKSRNESCRAIG